MDYITLNEAIDLIIAIPESVSGDTVTYEIIDASGSVLASGNMSFVRDELWKVNYTPTATGTIVLKVNDTTISSKRENFYRVIGASVSIPTAPTGDDLTTVANVKANYGLDTNITTHDTMLQNLITQNSKQISEECGRTFAAADYTEYYDGDGSDILMVNQYPINSITSIHDDVDRNFNSDTLIDSSYYHSVHDDAKGGIIRGDGVVFSKGKRNIKVVYNGGFSTLPGDLVKACEQMVMADYIEHTASVNTAVSDEIIYKPEKLRKEAAKVIRRYKRYA